MNKTSAAVSLPAVVDQERFSNRKKPHGYWDDFAIVERELLAFIEVLSNSVETKLAVMLLDDNCLL
jgi:hypothetical protein